MEINNIQYPLLSSWTLWETFQTDYISKNKQDTESYKSKVSRIQKFESLDEFAILWNSLPHSDPATFFYKKSTSSVRKYIYSKYL